jgi:hypothetical protein
MMTATKMLVNPKFLLIQLNNHQTQIERAVIGQYKVAAEKKVKSLIKKLIFSSPDPKGHVSYSHHLASVVRRKLFKKSSPLKVLDQWKPNLV